MQPRPYQQQFIEAVEAGWSQFKKQLGVAPTGSGKTILFSFLAKRLLDRTGQRTCILCHREELIDQAIAKLHAATGIIADKEKAEWTARLTAPVVVASVQTMVRRLDRWPKNHFGLVVLDEAHHLLAESFLKVMQHWDANILGVTATPDRADKKNLGEFFENIACEIKLVDLIKDGYLCPITIKSMPLRIDLSEVKSLAGDLDSGQLAHVLEPFLGQIAASVKANIGNRQTVCFLPLIAISQKFVGFLRELGVDAEHIDGVSEDRKQKLERFEKQEFQLLSNAMLLTEGWDCPPASCIVPLRATRSRPLFAQMCGRGTRTFPGKEDLLLLDLLFTHERHSLVRPASLIAATEEEAEEMMEAVDEKAAAGGEDEDGLDLLGLQSDCAQKREEALRKKLEQLNNRKAKFISAEEFALRHHQLAIAEYEPTMKWHVEGATDRQLEFIEKAGIDRETVRDKGHACAILDVVFTQWNAEPASSKQRWVMRQSGWVSKDGLRDASNATRGDAREFFAARRQ